MRTFERLSIPFEEAGDATDIPPMQTPGFSTAVDELVLGQILADISHRHIRAVGIIATDPLDIVFLAKEVRQFLPDVRLFATQSYLLFTHPQNVDDLRGMIVASTYPLYPSNQSWSYSYQGDRTHVFFSSESGQGTYNAAIAHLDKIGDEEVPPRFLEYGLPFDPPGSYVSSDDGSLKWSTPTRQPPIWIGMVGNKGIYPLRAVTKTSDQDRSYLYGHDQSARKNTPDLSGWPALRIRRRSKPNPGPGFGTGSGRTSRGPGSTSSPVSPPRARRGPASAAWCPGGSSPARLFEGPSGSGSVRSRPPAWRSS